MIQNIKTVKLHTPSPDSEPELDADIVCMRTCAASENWICVPGAWRSGLLPEGCIVERIDKAENHSGITMQRCSCIVVLKATGCGFVHKGMFRVHSRVGSRFSRLSNGAYIQHGTYTPWFRSPRNTFPPSLVS